MTKSQNLWNKQIWLSMTLFMWTVQWSILSPPGQFCWRALERRLHRFVTVWVACDNICLHRSRLLSYTVIFTSVYAEADCCRILSYLHEACGSVIRWILMYQLTSWQTPLPHSGCLGLTFWEIKTPLVNINNQIRKNVNSKMTDVVLKCIWPDLRTVKTGLKDFCLRTSWRLGNVALKRRPGPGQSQTLGRSWGDLLILWTVKSCQLVWIVS